MQLSETIQQLENSAAAIAALAAGIGAEQACWKPTPASWSLLEVICHLGDEEREDFRTHLQGALQQPVAPWSDISPEHWPGQRGYNQRELARCLAQFLAERAVSLAWLRGLAAAQDWPAGYDLSFGKLSAGALLVSWAAHDLLHLRQLVELRYAWQAQQALPFELLYAGEW